MLETKKSFWPYGILLSLLAIIIACIVTIFIASHHPVYEDDFYFDSYQNVENIGKRKIPSYEVDQNSYVANFKISALQNINSDDLKVQALLTRPFTKNFDQKLEGQVKNGILSIALPKLDKGRWELKLKFYANQETVGFFSYELNAQ